ncbi:MAG: hypothetical protein M1834_009196 [Cirrosporium novae-zelandiae]|nr:MAG: hypothetical protein M1834_009196 [Cirrosporium novae-zelandiae]
MEPDTTNTADTADTAQENSRKSSLTKFIKDARCTSQLQPHRSEDYPTTEPIRPMKPRIRSTSVLDHRFSPITALIIAND